MGTSFKNSVYQNPSIGILSNFLIVYLLPQALEPLLSSLRRLHSKYWIVAPVFFFVAFISKSCRRGCYVLPYGRV